MASPLAVGAGAGAGLDDFLHRLLLEQQVNETGRHNMATEDLSQQTVNQNNDVKESLSALRKAQEQGLADAQAERTSQSAAAQKLLDDPNTPENVKTFLKVRTALPKGENIPSELVAPKPAAKKTPQMHWGDVDMTDGAGRPQHLKNVPVVFDPEDQSMSVAGAKVDPKSVHGVQSPSLLAAGLQWDPAQGLLIDKKNATAKPVTGPNGPLQPDLTSSTRTMKEGATALLPHIADISSQAEALDKAGLFGPAMSRIRQIAAKVGTIDEFYDAVSSDPQLKGDEKIGKFATSLGLLATGAGRVHGGARGGGSPQMYEHFKQMLSDTGTLNMFKGRLGAVNDFMQGYANMGGAAPSGSGGGVDDLYNAYLNRNKKD